ncbi:MAG TPA: FkbM family methyltransferase [Candidatus Binataceae bacterium]|nr:FkbM family methyltransferase [Candidatus Binataceae bacterium]
MGISADLIYDVGSHAGEDSEFYLKKGFRVVAIEAVPELCEIAQKRLSAYVEGGRFTVLNGAIAETSQPIRFFVNNLNDDWGTTSLEWMRRNEGLGAGSCEITVRGLEFGQVLKEYGVPYYLKIDIEGADLLCVRALRDFASRPRYISLESTMTSWNGLLREFALLKELRYTKFKVVQQMNMNRQTCPFPAREGKYVDHRFDSGASGLFGEEAPGRWLTEAEALEKYQRIFRLYRLFAYYGIFTRVRLARPLVRMAGLDPGWYDTHAALY